MTTQEVGTQDEIEDGVKRERGPGFFDQVAQVLTLRLRKNIIPIKLDG